MRIVSQDGTLELPYEETIFMTQRVDWKNETWFNIVADVKGRVWIIAGYSTIEKAEEAMRRCRRAYGIYMQSVLKPREVSSLEDMEKRGSFTFPKEEDVVCQK